MTTQVIMPVRDITIAIRNACVYTAVHLAEDLRDYLLLRFSEPKSGKLWKLDGFGRRRQIGTTVGPRGGIKRVLARRGERWYRASAPGEYPAIKYGILYQSLQLGRPTFTENSGAVRFGVAPFSKSIYGTPYAPPDPDYAEVLEGLVSKTGLNGKPEPMRPYLRRAVLETAGGRPNDARAYFLTSLYNKAMASRRVDLPGRLPIPMMGTAMALGPALPGKDFTQIAAEIASGSATVRQGNFVFNP